MLEKYYQKLGLNSSASLDEVKTAYRRLAKQYHPDVNKEKNAVKQFIAINEAYEYILQVSENESENEKPKSKTRAQDMEIRMEKARARFEKMKQEEARRNEIYYQKIATGSKFKKYRKIAIFTALLGIILLFDGLLPGTKQVYTVKTINYYNPFHGLKYDNVVEVSLTPGNEIIWVNRPFGYFLLHTDKVVVERSLLFKDILSISLPKNPWIYSKNAYSIQGLFPLVSILLFFPLFVLLLKSRTLLYSILFESCYYLAILSITVILLSNFRWLHFITLGYF